MRQGGAEDGMALTKDQEILYRQTMEEAKKQIEDIDQQMRKEIELTRKKLAELQESKKSYNQVYEGACRLLGILSEKKDNPDKKPSS